MKKIITLDFDGVIHSYMSRWKNARTIPDPPVPGALQFIVEGSKQYSIAIHSSRSHQWGGRRAMKKWLFENLAALSYYDNDHEWWVDYVAQYACGDPWQDTVRYAAQCVVKGVKWPLFKPASFVTIDDRAICFTGRFPSMTEISSFAPWNRKDQTMVRD